MAKYDDRKLYWIKLTDNFMTSDTVDFLMEQKDGSNYVVLYQMLCLKTINNNGELSRKLGEVIIPYDEEKIQRDCKWFPIDTVRCALELYKKLGLIYVNENGNLQIANFERLIGSQTIGAEKKQEQLAKKQNILIETNKKVDSYDQILEDFGCSGVYREAILDFVKHLLLNGIKMTNDRLESLIVNVDRQYQEDIDKANYIHNAIKKGYKFLDCEILEKYR